MKTRLDLHHVLFHACAVLIAASFALCCSPAQAQQKFYLDFDSTLALPEGSPGKPIPKWRYEYSMLQTDAITGYLDTHFGMYGMEFIAGLPDIPGAGSVIKLNDATFGGGSEGIDFRNLDDDDGAKINVLSILEFLGEDLAAPSYTEEDIAFATANIVGHEAIHLMGVRHHDAHGPIGTGIGPGTVPEDFLPTYMGPIGGPDTGFSFAAAHAGGANFSLAGLYSENFVSERTAVKLLAASEGAEGLVLEDDGMNNSPLDAQPFEPDGFIIPYPLRPEIDPDDLPPGEPLPRKPVAIAGVAQVITGTLDTPSPIDPDKFIADYYSFAGAAGETWTFEVMSYILPGDGAAEFRYGDNADVAIALLDSSGSLVAINDDDDDTPAFPSAGFLGSATIFDVTLTESDIHTLEIFVPGPGFPVPGSDKTGTDGGSYEIFAYRAFTITVPEPAVLALLIWMVPCFTRRR